MQSYLTELTGSFFLILAIGLTGDALASGLLIIGIIYAGRLFSHAHFNPAVSLAFWSAGRMSRQELWALMGCQVAGATAGCLLIYGFSGTTFQTAPPASSTLWQSITIEFLFGFLLAMLYLVQFATRGSRRNQVYGLVIGLTYSGMLLIGTAVSGGVINPSASLGAAVTDLFFDGDTLNHLPAFVLSSSTGGLIAGILFTYHLNSENRTPAAR